MKNAMTKQAILSTLISSIDEITTCSLCKDTKDVRVCCCGHLYCLVCIEKIRKPPPSIYVFCKICNRSMVHKDNKGENEVLVLLNKLKFEINQQQSTDFMCQKLVEMFSDLFPMNNQKRAFSNRPVIRKSVESKVEGNNEVKTENKDSNISECKINKRSTVKESNEADKCIRKIQDSNKMVKNGVNFKEDVSLKDNISERKRRSCTLKLDEIKKCKLNYGIENDSSDIFVKPKTSNGTKNLIKDVSGAVNGVIRNDDLQNGDKLKNKLENVPSEMLNVESRLNVTEPKRVSNENRNAEQLVNKGNNSGKKTSSSKIPNNRTLIELKKNFNIPSAEPLLIQKTKIKMSKKNQSITDSSINNKSDEKNLSNKQEDIVCRNEAKQFESEYAKDKHCEDSLVGNVEETEIPDEVFPTQVPEETTDVVNLKPRTEVTRLSDVTGVEDNNDIVTTNNHCSVACQTTSDLHRDLLFKEFPDLLANLSSVIAGEGCPDKAKQYCRVYNTPIERKCHQDLKTPIDSGTGKSVIVSSVTSSERKNFDENEFMNTSTICCSYSADSSRSNRTITSIVNETPSRPVAVSDKDILRKRSLAFVNHLAEVPNDDVIPMDEEINELIDEEMAGISLLDKDANIVALNDYRSASDGAVRDSMRDDDGSIFGTPLKSCRPEENEEENMDIGCSDDMIASTPTMHEPVLSNDGTLGKLIERSNTDLDSTNCSTSTNENDTSHGATNDNLLEKERIENSKIIAALIPSCPENVPKNNTSTKKKKKKKDGVVDRVKKKLYEGDADTANANHDSAAVISAACREKQLAATENNYCFVTSGLNQAEMSAVKLMAEKMSVKYSNKLTNETTHLIVKVDENNRVSRTLKYFQAVSKHIPIVSFKWIETCYRKNKFVKEENFMPLDFSGECGPFRSFLAYRGLGNSLDWLRNYCIFFSPPYPPSCPLPQLQDLAVSIGSFMITEIDEFRKYPKHHNMIIVADEVDECSLSPIQITDWVKTYKAVTVQFSWLIEVIGRYRAVPFFSYQIIPFDVCHLTEMNFPPDMLESDGFSDDEE